MGGHGAKETERHFQERKTSEATRQSELTSHQQAEENIQEFVRLPWPELGLFPYLSKDPGKEA